MFNSKLLDEEYERYIIDYSKRIKRNIEI